MAHVQHKVYRLLSDSGAVPQATTTLPDGQAFVRWSNDYNDMRYVRPGHHAVSVYLDGGQHSVRLKAGRAVNRGFPGAVCVLPAEHVSEWHIGAPFHFLHFYFDERHLARTVEQTWDAEPASATLEPQYLFEDAVLANAARLIVAGDWHDSAGVTELDHLAQWLLLHVARYHTRRARLLPSVRGRLSPRQAVCVREFIEANLDQPLTLEGLAGLAHLSPYHFARLFRATFGQPPHQYVLHRRMDRARELVVDTSDKIISIALSCGFRDHSQFSRAFRRHHGVAPSSLRREDWPNGV